MVVSEHAVICGRPSGEGGHDESHDEAVRSQAVASRGGATGSAQIAPVSGWRRVVTDWSAVGVATALCHALGAVTSLLLRMLLSPAEMGIWQGLKLLLSYGNYANVGISKGAAREYTVALGRGDTDRARRGLDLALTVNTVTSLLYGLALAGAGLWIGWSGHGAWAGSWAGGLMVIGAVAVLSRYVSFHVTLLRASQAFGVAARVAVLEALLTLAVCGWATWQFGLPGLYGGTVAVVLGTLVYVVAHRAVSLGWAWDAGEARRLVAIGAPILLAGTISSLLRSLDKWMILGYLPDREFQLGCYSLALMVTAQLYGLANMLAMVMAPRYGEAYGRWGSEAAVARLAARSTEAIASLVALPAGLSLVVAGPLLGRLLPDYRPGFGPLLWLVPGVAALGLSLPATQYLVAVGRQKRALVAAVVGTAMAAAGNHVALTTGLGLAGVAAASALAYAGYYVLCVGMSLWPHLAGPERMRYLAAIGMVTVPTLAAAVGCELVQAGWQGSWAVLGVKSAAILAVWAAGATAVWHWGGWPHARARAR